MPTKNETGTGATPQTSAPVSLAKEAETRKIFQDGAYGQNW